VKQRNLRGLAYFETAICILSVDQVPQN